MNWVTSCVGLVWVLGHRHTSGVSVYSQYLPSPATLVGREGRLHPQQLVVSGDGVRLAGKAMNHLGHAYGLCLLTMQEYANANANMSRICY